ncbi:MAG TPA: sulfatase-like hydrolase/transferase [Terriglobales bacterium]|nr:sulfatase-like hydrolase/transferase [Terriglobales bacterium]
MEVRVPTSIKWLALLLLAAGSSLTSWAEPANVILITLDTTRADRMGFLGSSRGLTPNLDALARQSAVFLRAYSQVPLTTPSHATILTGTYPQFNHVSDLGSPLEKGLPYLPEILRRQGYRTAAFVGSQVLDPKSASAPGFNRGFDTYDAPFHARRPGEDRYHSIERRGMEVVEQALGWLNRRPRGPFFLWLHFYDPHDPYDPPPPFKTQYASSPYDGEIAYVDSAVGRLLAALRTRGLYQHTLLVVVADHGEAFGEHGELSHGLFLYDDTLHVPLLMKLPGTRARHLAIESRVGLVDIAPTLLQELGISPPPAMQGASLLQLMKGVAGQATTTARSGLAARTPDRPEYAETDYPHRAFGWSSLRSWRAGKYLYIDAPERELYDQTTDPGDLHNLAGSAPAVADAMAAQLETFRRKTFRTGGAQTALTPQQAAQLQALGYVTSGSSKPEEEEKRGADPKEKVGISNSLHRALLETEEQQYRDAIPLLEQVLQAEPGIAIANLQLGRAWNSLGEYAKAVPCLQKAVELTPQSVDAHYELGAALGEMGDWEGSAKQMQAALAQEPNSDELHFYLGSAYEESGRIADAMKEYQAATRLNPDNYRANLLLGRLLAMQNRAAEALPYLKKAVQLQPNSADAHKFLGNVYTVLGDEAKARQEQDQAQRLQQIEQP